MTDKRDGAETTQATKLYFGSLPQDFPQFESGFIGLSLHPKHDREILHDVTTTLPFDDESVQEVQVEEVLEHVEYAMVPRIFNDIWRVLSPEGHFRLSVPDYRSPVLSKRSLYDRDGNVVCDTMMGGKVYYNRETGEAGVRFTAGGGAHLWFPNYELVMKAIMDSGLRICRKIQWHHYWRNDSQWVVNPYDVGSMPVKRSPPSDMRAEGKPISIIVDFIK